MTKYNENTDNLSIHLSYICAHDFTMRSHTNFFKHTRKQFKHMLEQ